MANTENENENEDLNENLNDHNDDDDDDDDPFSCFGTNNSSDDDDDDDDDDKDSDIRNIDVTNSSSAISISKDESRYTDANADANVDFADAERGQRLLSESIYRKLNAETDHVPLVQKDDFEVFDTAITDATPTIATTTITTAAAATKRGKGIRVCRSYKEGEEIMREGTCIRVPGKIYTASTQEQANSMFHRNVQLEYSKLSAPTKIAYMQLSSCRYQEEQEEYQLYYQSYQNQQQDVDDENDSDVTDSQLQLQQRYPFLITDIYETNIFQLGHDLKSGLFLTISRINHSCRPNVHHVWRPDVQETIIVATRSLQKGEEIFTTYGPSECLTTKDRRMYLQQKYSFFCICDMCLEENSNGGDDRMMELDTIFDTISMFPLTTTTNDEHKNNNSNNTSTTEKALEAVDRGLLLLKQQGLGSGAYVKSFLHNGYQISLNAAASQARPQATSQEVALQATSTVSSSNTMCLGNDTSATATAIATATATATATTIKNNTNTSKYDYYQNLARSYLQQELIAVQNSEGIGSYRGIDIERTLQWHGWG